MTKQQGDMGDKNDIINNIEKNKQYFLKIVELCKARNIKLIIVTPPAASCYNKYIDTDCRDRMQRMIELMMSNYDKIMYFDYLEDERFDDNDFMDPDHLNRDYGAIKYTNIINALI